LKILYHHRTQAEDAQGVHIYEMVNAFRELDHHVEMVALVEKDIESDEKTKGAAWEGLAKAVPNWIYELLELAYNIVGFLSLARKIRSMRPTFIYERYSLNTFCGVWASKLFRIPILLEVNAPLYLEQMKLGKLVFKRFAQFSERWICSNATSCIVVTNVMKEMFVQQGVPAEQFIVMHNGINPSRFQAPDNSDIRNKFGLENSLVIGFVGWFRKWHGLEMLVRLFHENSFASKGAKLFLVGEGPSLPDLEGYVKQHSLENDVIFAGPVDKADISSYISAFDIAVQPSATPYACPMKLIEYMAMGKCIIAPDQPNIQEMLDDKITGIFFKMGDEESFGAALKHILTDDDKRKLIGRQAFEAIEQRGLLWKRNAERSIELIENAIKISQEEDEHNTKRTFDVSTVE
jgi:glycosyltransferase involved in cell wall biosynthesis